MLERTTQGISSLLEEQLLPATCAEMGAAGRNPALLPARSSQDLSIIAVYDRLFALRVSKIEKQQPGKEKWVCRRRRAGHFKRSSSPLGSGRRDATTVLTKGKSSSCVHPPVHSLR